MNVKITIEQAMVDAITDVGGFVVAKYRAQQAKVGTLQAARNMRKQGFPLALARAVLRRTSPTK